MSFSFNSQIQRGLCETKYSIQVETDSKDQFRFIEEIARECIDGKHKSIKVKVKKSMCPRCYKCVWQSDCTIKDPEYDYTKC